MILNRAARVPNWILLMTLALGVIIGVAATRLVERDRASAAFVQGTVLVVADEAGQILFRPDGTDQTLGYRVVNDYWADGGAVHADGQAPCLADGRRAELGTVRVRGTVEGDHNLVIWIRCLD